MSVLVLIDPGKDHATKVKEATEKYAGIFSVKMDFMHCKSANEMGGFISMGKKIKVVVINKVFETPELNAFHASFMRTKGPPPLLIVAGEQQGIISPKFPKSRIIFNGIADKEFIYDCLRLHLADENRKIDVRIFREILNSVCDVLYKNTKEKLSPQSVIESKASAENQDVSGILAFFGEGIKGTLSIGTSLRLLKHFAAKILFCEPHHLTDEMLNDVMGELSNQVLGIVRNALGDYGYELNSSMQLVVTGLQHSFHPSSSGNYYILPFAFQDMIFKVTFCYDTYPIKLDRTKVFSDKNQSRILDIRLLNNILDAIPKTIALNTKIKVKRAKIEPLRADTYLTQALHVIHGRSEQGGYLLAIDIPEMTAREFAKKMLFCGDDELTQAMLIDAVGELVNQIQGSQKKVSEEKGYFFQNIFHCSFSSGSNLNYLMKNPGHYCRIVFETEAGEPFTCCFGLDSTYANKIFDASDLVKSIS
ncbi:MAG: chemotaxis protein CheX [Oligoflexales bacterium]|nr:chemotaxis protein CheX [Oligoflexales bacterium]